MPNYYPGWVMRLYFDLARTDPVLKMFCDLACSDNNLDICYIRELPGTPMIDASKVFPMNWRFFPTLDPQVILKYIKRKSTQLRIKRSFSAIIASKKQTFKVDIIISRDLDSRFDDREQAAVNEWIRSEKSFHIMRDHPQHRASILGGLWGSKLFNQDIRDRWKKSWSRSYSLEGKNCQGPRSRISWEAKNLLNTITN